MPLHRRDDLTKKILATVQIPGYGPVIIQPRNLLIFIQFSRTDELKITLVPQKILVPHYSTIHFIYVQYQTITSKGMPTTCLNISHTQIGRFSTSLQLKSKQYNVDQLRNYETSAVILNKLACNFWYRGQIYRIFEHPQRLK